MSGCVLERGALRYTPAGVPVVEFRLEHASEQQEAGGTRKVECELACIALDTLANLMGDAKPGDGLRVKGFLAARSIRNRTPVLHVTEIEFLQGN